MNPDISVGDLPTDRLARLAGAALRHLAARVAAGDYTAFADAFDTVSSEWGPGRGSDREYPLQLHGIREAQPGKRWQALFRATWPAYRSWFLRDGDGARPTLATASRRLKEHLPELVPTWERLVDLAGGDETAARMLASWDPPHFAPACAQAVVLRDEPVLVRNYDYDLHKFEQVVYSSAFTGRRVVGTGDCLWGLLDGVNDAGLAVSFTFGGRRDVGAGFGVPLVVRYLLETCETTGEARRALARVPVDASYNVTALDRTGRSVTGFLAPRRPTEFSDLPAVTNHRGHVVDWPEFALKVRSVERHEHVLRALATGADAAAVAETFLAPPMHQTGYSRGFGTLYTAALRPASGTIDYRWPDTSWQRGFDSAPEIHGVVLREPGRQEAAA